MKSDDELVKDADPRLTDDEALAALEAEIEQLRQFVRAAQAEQEKLEARLQPLRARLALPRRGS
ncbi:MAG: hypothetical protein Q8L48_13535 [Archangium sp.]|nr:hypothetical protein [Archangium sp.]